MVVVLDRISSLLLLRNSYTHNRCGPQHHADHFKIVCVCVLHPFTGLLLLCTTAAPELDTIREVGWVVVDWTAPFVPPPRRPPLINRSINALFVLASAPIPILILARLFSDTG